MKYKFLKRVLTGFLAMTLAVTSFSLPGQQVLAEEAAEITEENVALRTRYDEPAAINTYASWEQWSLPIGNSEIGASVFGGVTRERIQLNQKSLWSGGPSESRPAYTGDLHQVPNGSYIGGNIVNKGNFGASVKTVQDLFAQGNSNAATSNCNSLLVGVGDDAGTQGYGYYLSYGNMYLDFDYGTENPAYENYERTLDLRTAITDVKYDVNGVHYTRESFISYPDNVLVTHLTADQAGALDFNVTVEPDNVKGGGSNNPGASSYTREWTTSVENGIISILGDLDDNQMKFSSHTKVLADGEVVDNDSNITVKDATEVTIITSIGTDYKNEYPNYRTQETDQQVSARVLAYVTNASAKTYDNLRETHVDDYSEIFGRVELEIGQEEPAKTTDELLAAYNQGNATESERRYLEVMLFQFGRFLTIQSSRETPKDDPFRESLPSNLQGIWVGGNNSAWHSDYHLNVNLQMNYWPTYSTNMAECAIPLINYVDSLREPGRVTAEIYAGIASTEEKPENGFMAHTQNNPFGWTCPGWAFSWGWSPAAVPWILQNCWEHYEFTGDKEFMEEYIYPMMKEEAILYDQMLIRDANGKLVSSPSYSPEHGPYTSGNTYEQILIWQLYEDVITAAKTLNVDEELVTKWEANQRDLKGPIEIGESGQIKEWFEETTLGSVVSNAYSHRHISHMLGLFPGDYISVDTPELLQAARVSMENRTDESTGWGMGQRINTWARMGDGNKAYKLITDLFRRGILKNLWDTHAPFQIDGNFGYTSGVSEMLLQSNVGYINMLPALPDVWSTGSVEGLVARGNFEVDMKWNDKKVTEAVILSKNGGEAIVQADNISLTLVSDSRGNVIETKIINQNRISFDTIKGETYTIAVLPEGSHTLDEPQNVTAFRLDSDKVVVEWKPVEGENITYIVLRQIGDGEIMVVADALTNCEFTDTTAVTGFGDVKYQVKAVQMIDSMVVASKSTEPVVAEVQTLIDDRNPSVTYVGGGWEQYSEVGLINTTSTWIADNEHEGRSISTVFYGTGIEVYTCAHGDRGMADVYIDGVLQEQKADSYRSGKQNGHLTWSISGLENKRHTIELKFMGEKNTASSSKKFEFDAFKVIGNENVGEAVPTGITVSTLSGINTAVSENSSILLQALVTPEGSSQSVIWSVDNEELATISEEGLLTVKDRNGVVTVTATSTKNNQISGSMDITISIPGKDEIPDTETIHESENGQINDSRITFGGTWDRNLYDWNGTKKLESLNNADAFIEFTFTGNKVEFYMPKHQIYTGVKVILDGEEKETVTLYVNSTATQNEKIVLENLENTSHTVKLQVVDKTTIGQTSAPKNYGIALDYIVVYSPREVSTIDKSELQDLILAHSNYDPEEYTETTYQELVTALQQGGAVVNNAAATLGDVTDAINAITEAVNNLQTVEKEYTLTLTAVPLDTTSIGLKWSKVKSSSVYVIYKNDEEIAKTNETSYIVTGLAEGTSYNFTVQVEEEAIIKDSVEVTTLTGATDIDNIPEAAMNLRRASIYDYKVAWDASKTSNVVNYKVFLDGKEIANISSDQELSYDLTDVINNSANENFVVSVMAVSEFGISSLPVHLGIVKTELPPTPSDNNPESPSDNDSESPSDNDPESPSDNDPESPSDNDPESPSDNDPEQTIDWGEVAPEHIPADGKVPEGIWIGGIDDVEYTGANIIHKYAVYNGTKRLVEKKDYTIKYKNNKNAYEVGIDGTNPKKQPTITVMGKGNYNDKKEVNFDIIKVDFSVSDNGLVFTDLGVTPKNGKVTLKPYISFNGKKLSAKDFEISGSVPATDGTYQLTLKGKGNFKGERVINVTVSQTDTSMDKVAAVLDKQSKKVSYSGEEIKPVFSKVNNKKNSLTEGTHYTLRLENNVAAGTATAILEAIPGSGYIGEKAVTFTILPKNNIAKIKVNGLPKTGYAYTGTWIEPLGEEMIQENLSQAVVQGTTGNLINGVDYEVTYEKNVNKGTATMVITGIPENGSTGTKKVKFKIDADTIAKADGFEFALVEKVSSSDANGSDNSTSGNSALSMDDSQGMVWEEIAMNSDGNYEVPYEQGGSRPVVMVKNPAGKVLEEGVDYTVTYKDNNKLTSAKAIVKGKGNYKGQDEINFTVIVKNVDETEGVSIVAKDKVENKKGAWKQNFKVVDSNGKAIPKSYANPKEAKYYLEAVYENGIRVEKEEEITSKTSQSISSGAVIRVELKLRDNYVGTAIGRYQIIEKGKDISKAKIVITPQVYTGEEILLDDKAITSSSLGKSQIKYGEHFEIVEGSYVKNINKGTAKVTFKAIEGSGYGGTKTVTFKINPMSVKKAWENLYNL